ncbi:MAG: CDP-diacylglycerol--glycerol-3-phosphate 3-phosphatidyltransferase [Candidatus Woesearchaeota archaeon]
MLNSGKKQQGLRNSINLANKITLSRVLGIPLFIIIFFAGFRYSNYFAALIFTLLISLDLLDGYVARKYNQVTEIGAMLDPLADKLLVSAALIFLIGRGVDAWMAYVILARELIVTGLRSLATLKGKSIHAKTSGKIKTFSQNIAILTVLISIPYSWYFMLVATVITIYSGLAYLWIERSLLKEIF